MRKFLLFLGLLLFIGCDNRELGYGNNLKNYIKIDLYAVDKNMSKMTESKIDIGKCERVLSNSDFLYIKLMEDLFVKYKDPNKCYSFVAKLKEKDKLINITIKHSCFLLVFNNTERQKIIYSNSSVASSIEYGFFSKEEIKTYVKKEDYDLFFDYVCKNPITIKDVDFKKYADNSPDRIKRN